jgi:lysophospholipase L1-like esterase
MPVLRLKQPGWETFTGSLHTIEFVNGVSTTNVDAIRAGQLAMSFKVEDNAFPGVAYGPAENVTSIGQIPTGSKGSVPSTATIVEVPEFADQTDAESGVNDDEIMTPLRTRQALAAQVSQIAVTLGGIPAGRSIGATLSAVQHPGLFNLKSSGPGANLKTWRKALARVRAGAGQAKILCVGDSTTFGMGAGTGAQGTIGARTKSWPVKLAEILNAAGIPAHAGSICGNGALTDADFVAYDPRLTLGAGWAQSTVTSLATRTWLNTTSVNPLNFTPARAFDTIEVYYLQNAGYGTFTVGVDGGAAAATINAAGAQALMKATVTVPKGTHTINIARNGTGAGVHIAHINTFDSTAPAVSVINAGWSGAATSSWDSVTSPWSPGNAIGVIAPDLTILNLGINNWRAAPPVDVPTFKTQLANTLLRAKATGDVILLGPPPSEIGAALPENQAAYLLAIYEIALANNVPVIDITQRFGSHEDANALGFYFDQLHPNGLGYADIAHLISLGLIV